MADDDLGLTPEQRQQIRRSLLSALAKRGVEGNASAAKAALELLGEDEDRPRRGDTERDRVMAWLAERPGTTAVDAVAHWWPQLTGEDRSRRLCLVRQWSLRLRRSATEAPLPAVQPAPPPQPPPEEDWASLPRAEFLRRQLAGLLGAWQTALARGETARIPSLDARIERARKLLDAAIAEEGGEAGAQLDRSPVDVAAEIERRDRVLAILRRVRS